MRLCVKQDIELESRVFTEIIGLDCGSITMGYIIQDDWN